MATNEEFAEEATPVFEGSAVQLQNVPGAGRSVADSEPLTEEIVEEFTKPDVAVPLADEGEGMSLIGDQDTQDEITQVEFSAELEKEDSEPFLADQTELLSGPTSGSTSLAAVLIDEQGVHIPIENVHDKPFVIGREQSCTLTFNKAGVSREHAEISQQFGRLIIKDLSSLNGTWVNDYKIDRVILEDGDVIKIGEGQLVFKLPQEQSSVAQDKAEETGTTRGQKKLAWQTYPIGKKLLTLFFIFLPIIIVLFASFVVYEEYKASKVEKVKAAFQEQRQQDTYINDIERVAGNIGNLKAVNPIEDNVVTEFVIEPSQVSDISPVLSEFENKGAELNKTQPTIEGHYFEWNGKDIEPDQNQEVTLSSKASKAYNDIKKIDSAFDLIKPIQNSTGSSGSKSLLASDLLPRSSIEPLPSNRTHVGDHDYLLGSKLASSASKTAVSLPLHPNKEGGTEKQTVKKEAVDNDNIVDKQQVQKTKSDKADAVESTVSTDELIEKTDVQGDRNRITIPIAVNPIKLQDENFLAAENSASTSSYSQPLPEDSSFTEFDSQDTDPFRTLIETRLKDLESSSHTSAFSNNNVVGIANLKQDPAQAARSASEFGINRDAMSMSQSEGEVSNVSEMPTTQMTKKKSSDRQILGSVASVKKIPESGMNLGKQVPSIGVKQVIKDQVKQKVQASKQVKLAQKSFDQQARELIINVENDYKSGQVEKMLRELKDLKSNSRVSSRLRNKMQELYNTYQDLYTSYSKGKMAFEQGYKNKAFKHWLAFLRNEKSILGGEKSVYQKKVAKNVANEFMSRAMQAEANAQWHTAYKYWSSARKYSNKEKAQEKIDAMELRAQNLYDKGVDLESTDVNHARRLWREVMNLMPPGHDLYTKAAAKVEWYEQWSR